MRITIEGRTGEGRNIIAHQITQYLCSLGHVAVAEDNRTKESEIVIRVRTNNKLKFTKSKVFDR